jgi:ubiquinol-cytochrome c reductase cytochrome b subunit
LEYQGAAVPKRMNKLGSAGAPGTGSFLRADPESEREALVEAAHASERRALTAVKEYQDEEIGTNGHSGNGHSGNGHH